jgi:guanine deaminase
MSTSLSSDDVSFLERAIEISRRFLEDEGKTPLGAIVVIDGQMIAEGTSSVVELRDPTAHAEVMALRNAGAALGRHLFEDGVMYASSEPCPMCLCACYWARLRRLVFGATSYDVATFGFEDLQLYREMSRSAEKRFLQEEVAEGALREKASDVTSFISAREAVARHLQRRVARFLDISDESSPIARHPGFCITLMGCRIPRCSRAKILTCRLRTRNRGRSYRDSRTAGWPSLPGQDPGQHGPEHQPRGADRQLSPAHHGRATNVGYNATSAAGARWACSPGSNGLAHESEACNPRACPRNCAEPIARPPAAKPDEPGNQHRNRQSQPYDNC